LSFREGEEMMLRRGIVVSYETIRAWCRTFGQTSANQLRRRRPRPGDQGHLDEVFITIQGKTHYLGRAGTRTGLFWTCWSPPGGTPRPPPGSFAHC
ncbi:MAG: hypothetical protein ACRDSM_10915, partial [Pseudonocardiaceae bacterium]